jgi:hypothetical protein
MSRDQAPYTFQSWMDGAYHRSVAIPRENTALLVIDMQNAFLRPEHDLGLGEELALFAEAIPGCVRLVDAARQAEVPVIFARFSFLPGGGDRQLVRGIRRGEPHADILVAGSPGVEIINELTPSPGEVVIDKSGTPPLLAGHQEPRTVRRDHERLRRVHRARRRASRLRHFRRGGCRGRGGEESSLAQSLYGGFHLRHRDRCARGRAVLGSA